MNSLRTSLRALVQPNEAFAALAQESPRPGRAFGRMLLWWLPPALLHGFLAARGFLAEYGTLRAGHLPAWLGHLMLPGLDPDSTVAFLRGLPPPPDPGKVIAAVLVLVPVGVVGAWMHHAVWDHTALWILRGTKRPRGFRATMLAESQALRIAALGAWAGLLGYLPGAGLVLGIPLALLDVYLWLFRGFSLAAFHGTPTWKGLAATLLHAALLGLFALILVGMVLAMLGIAG